jgi:hypothetical protein
MVCMRYFFHDEMDLLGNDSSLSLGWFSIEDIEIVKETKCILLIALIDLADGLLQLKLKRNGTFAWHPCDSGETVIFRSKNNKAFEMLYKDFKANLDIDLFLPALFQLSKNVSAEMYGLRREVVNEGAYTDLITLINNWPFKM